ncbi:alginate lyase family protein [Stenotrophomonas sp. TWI377]|uniref:alginate lyase family protein n=1 Tax=Stenotrophomonas sp. TWI377 TaxID=3136775 RepID=UPI0032091900
MAYLLSQLPQLVHAADVQGKLISWCPGPSTNRAAVGPAHGYLHRPSRAQERVETEGTMPGNGLHDSSVRAKSDWFGMRLLALAWRNTGDKRYLDKVAAQFDSWMGVYHPSHNPINDTDLDALIDAYAITKDSLPEKTELAVHRFLSQAGHQYATEMTENQGRRGVWISNWQSHRIKLVTLIAVATDDSPLLDSAEQFYAAQVAENIDESGATYDYKLRDALHYAVYTLEPLTRSAIAAQSAGRDWFSSEGIGTGRLRKGILWLQEYASGHTGHFEFTNSRVPFDIARREAKVPGFSGTWRKEGANSLFWLASELDSTFVATATTLGPAPAWATACFGIPKK